MKSALTEGLDILLNMTSEMNPFHACGAEMEKCKELAAEMGFVDTSHRRATQFQKGEIHIWRIREGWQCADLVAGLCPDFPKARNFCNHRPYADLETALRTEGAK